MVTPDVVYDGPMIVISEFRVSEKSVKHHLRRSGLRERIFFTREETGSRPDPYGRSSIQVLILWGPWTNHEIV